MEKTITLPSKERMLERLIAVNDNTHLKERFYPKLLREAGNQKVAMGVVLMIQLAIHDYAQGMPPSVAVAMQLMVDRLIDALVEDAGVAQEAKEFYKKAMAAG